MSVKGTGAVNELLSKWADEKINYSADKDMEDKTLK